MFATVQALHAHYQAQEFCESYLLFYYVMGLGGETQYLTAKTSLELWNKEIHTTHQQQVEEQII